MPDKTSTEETLLDVARMNAEQAHLEAEQVSTEPYGAGNDFACLRRGMVTRLVPYFGHTAKTNGVPMTDAQASWISDIIGGKGSLARETARRGFVPVCVPPDLIALAEAGALTTDEACRVIATAIDSVPDHKRHSGESMDIAWPKKLVDSKMAERILAHYDATTLELSEKLVVQQKRDTTKSSVCVFLNNGHRTRKRYFSISNAYVSESDRAGYVDVHLPKNVRLVGNEGGHRVREMLTSNEVIEQSKRATEKLLERRYGKRPEATSERTAIAEGESLSEAIARQRAEDALSGEEHIRF